MISAKLALSVTFLVHCLQPQAFAVVIRGLDRSLVHLYDPAKDFTCLDGSETIPFDQVNDDYCDCPDGSDEPGTSACPNGKFYCRNAGHVAHYVWSSRVHDGICDCCDGSDESDGACQDVCLELGAEMRAQREKERLAAEQGFAVRQQMVAQAEQMLAETRSSIASKEAEIEQLKKSIDIRRAEKEAAEAPEKEALDKYAEEEERAKAAKEAVEQEANKAEALEAMAKMDANGDGKISRDEVMANLAFDTNNDGMVGEEEADFYMAEHTEYDQEAFLNTAWNLMKPVVKGVGGAAKPVKAAASSKKRKARDPDAPVSWNEAGQQVDEEGVPIEGGVDEDVGVEGNADDLDEDLDEMEEEYDDYDEQDHDEEGREELDSEDSPLPPPHQSNDQGGEKKYDEATQTLVDIADRARKAYDDASNQLRDLERDLRDLKDVANGDYGESNEFLPLKGQCFEFRNNEYVYKLCPFDHTSQRGINGGGETRMGSWDRWDGPIPDTFSRMKFSNGQSCWNGPARSTTVKLVCGTENVVESVTEPNRCEYEMLFSTPVICKSPEHYAAQDNHDEL